MLVFSRLSGLMVWFECVTSYLHLSNRVVRRLQNVWCVDMLDTEGIHEHLVFMKGWDMMGCSFFAAEFRGFGVADLSKQSEHLSDTPHAKMESFGRELPIVVSLALFAMLIISCTKTLLSLTIQSRITTHNLVCSCALQYSI